MQAPLVALVSIEILPSSETREVAADAATRGRPMPPVAIKVTVAQPVNPMPSPSTTSGSVISSLVPNPGVARVSTWVPSNVPVTLDPMLAKRMVDFLSSRMTVEKGVANNWWQSSPDYSLNCYR